MGGWFDGNFSVSFGPKPRFRLWIWTWTKLNNKLHFLLYILLHATVVDFNVARPLSRLLFNT